MRAKLRDCRQEAFQRQGEQKVENKRKPDEIVQARSCEITRTVAFTFDLFNRLGFTLLSFLHSPHGFLDNLDVRTRLLAPLLELRFQRLQLILQRFKL